MAEIARRCRLSKATVSRALSLPAELSRVNADTRERIIDLAKGMGYRPNWRARAFSQQKTQTVGLIISGLLPQHEAIPHQILEAFTKGLRENGYHLSLVPMDGARDWRDLVFGGHVDGCATINDPTSELVEELTQRNLPTVAMNASPNTPLPVVTADDVQGGREVGRYLANLGHRRVAMYVNDDAVPHFSQQDRLRGVTEGLRAVAGESDRQDEDRSGAVSVQFVHDSHNGAVARILEQPMLPTALVCYSHYEALPFLRELCKRNIRVPEQMSVITFNDVFPLQCTMPALTTVAVPAEKIGSYAARELLEQIKLGARSEASVKMFKESLVFRESCAPPPPDLGRQAAFLRQK